MNRRGRGCAEAPASTRRRPTPRNLRRHTVMFSKSLRPAVAALAALYAILGWASPALADETSLKLPDLASVSFLGGSTDGRSLHMAGMGVSVLGMVFGLAIYMQLNKLPVHRAMREISELIYETCK